MRFIAYKTGVSCIGKISGYYVFYNYITDRYNVEKDIGQETINPPYCSYLLETILKLKDIEPKKIGIFIRQWEKQKESK